MNDKIDIVVTYLNSNDEQWQKDFTYWKEREIKEGKTEERNRQAFGTERIREWNTFQYWFRGIEKNCPWVNKVFLVVQNEKHVPKWLNTEHPKLRVVYHEEYIPKELLPTFNALTIVMYLSNIKDLSNNFIISDDDIYFLNPIKEDRFFKNNIPVHLNNKTKYELYDTNGTDGIFWQTLNNNLEFEKKYMKELVKYGLYHLPSARNKEFENKILKDNEEYIFSRQIVSKFRNPYNLCDNMFNDLLKICNKAVLGDPYFNCFYVDLKSDLKFSKYFKADIVCFNDTERLDKYNKTQKRWEEFLKTKFPNKSSFEK